MNSAIIFVKNQKEADLASNCLFDKYLIDYTVSEIKRLDVDAIYLAGNLDFEVENVVKRDNIEEIIDELKETEGKCLLVSPFYPLIDKEEYQKLLSYSENTVFVDEDSEIVPVFSIDNKYLASFDKLAYSGIAIDAEKAKRFTGIKDISVFQDIIKEKINNKWLNKGVIITDSKNTIIGVDVSIDKNTTIYPNTVIEGKCLIGKNNVITSGTFMKNVVLGDSNTISNSNIKDTIIHNNVVVGTNSVIDEDSELFDEVIIRSQVKLSNAKIGKGTIVEPLTYLGNAQIGESVKIGAGVVTVDNDGRSKHSTVIKYHSVVGSNVTLIAPIAIGEYVVVAAGSTIDQDIKDGDMAIARLYQQNKKGYGYKYIRED